MSRDTFTLITVVFLFGLIVGYVIPRRRTNPDPGIAGITRQNVGVIVFLSALFVGASFVSWQRNSTTLIDSWWSGFFQNFGTELLGAALMFGLTEFVVEVSRRQMQKTEEMERQREIERDRTLRQQELERSREAERRQYEAEQAREKLKNELLAQIRSRSNDFAIFGIERLRQEPDFLLEGDQSLLINLQALDAMWQGADLSEVNLTGANLERATISKANLEKARLVGANLRDANASGAYMLVANMERTTLIEANFAQADMRYVNGKGVSASGILLVKANLEDAMFAGGKFTGADLTGANGRAVNLSKSILLRATMNNSNFYEADLSGANLQAVQARRANISRTTLAGSDLREADLFGANLWGVNLERANARWANLSGVNLQNALLRHAEFDDAVFDENTVLPDARLIEDTNPLQYTHYWTPETDMLRYTDPTHADFWQPEWAAKPAPNRPHLYWGNISVPPWYAPWARRKWDEQREQSIG